jgi:hypothetical protein
MKRRRTLRFLARPRTWRAARQIHLAWRVAGLIVIVLAACWLIVQAMR